MGMSDVQPGAELAILTRFRTLLDASNDAFLLLEVPTGRLVDFNATACRLLGRERQQLLELPMAELLPPTVWARLTSLLEVARQRGDQRETLEEAITRPDGQQTPVEMTIGLHELPEGWHGLIVARDISERRQGEAALRTSEQRFRELADLLPAIVFETDLRGHLTFANHWAFQMTGVTPDELARGLPAVALLPPEEREQGLAALTRRVQGQPVLQNEYTFVRKDGSRFPVLITSTPILHDGEPAGMRGLVVDLTEKKQQEAKQTRQDEGLKRAQKLETLGRLAGGIAHDFNNLLTAILGYADLLGSRLTPDHPGLPDVEGIKQAALRSADLTRQLLAFGRKSAISPQLVDLNQHVGQSQRMLSRVIGEDVRLLFRPGPDVPTVRIDPGQLDQVLINLVVNSRDALPRGGTLTLETVRAVLDEEFVRQHPAASPGVHAQLIVRDNGCGIPPEVMEHLFEPFYTTKEKGRGTGLGLSTVYGIVQQHAGAVIVESERERGTTVRIYLPEVGAGSPTVAAPPPPPPRAGKATILLVEDDPGVRDLSLLMLEAAGYQVLVASSGEEGLRLAASRHEPIDLLVTDVVLPRLNGRELYQQLLPQRPKLKVLYISGYGGESLEDSGLADPDVDLLPKPFNYEMLSGKVLAVLNKP
jgi:PAS domain S-box-containing protein